MLAPPLSIAVLTGLMALNQVSLRCKPGRATASFLRCPAPRE